MPETEKQAGKLRPKRKLGSARPKKIVSPDPDPESKILAIHYGKKNLPDYWEIIEEAKRFNFTTVADYVRRCLNEGRARIKADPSLLYTRRVEVI